mgnify:FL=1
MNSKLNLIFVFAVLMFGLVFLNSKIEAQESLISNTISVQNHTLLSLIQSQPWTLVEKLNEKENELLAMPLWLGTKTINFYENRISGNGSITRKKLKEEERDIALKILNIQSGEIRIIKIRIIITSKNGLSIINPLGYKIELATRSSGIQWNKWNSMYKITEPESWIVIKNKYPEWETKNGKKVVEERIYAPYGLGLHQQEVIEAGREYLRLIARKTFEELAANEVYSRAVPGQLVADISGLNQAMFSRLPLIEGMDFSEFLADPQTSYERVLVLIGSNKDKAYYWTESSAGARGWLQYTPKTYKEIRKLYPAAKLLADHKTGASNHINSMKAAILLHDYNLAGLVKKFGGKILADPRLEEYLAAAYNGNPDWVHNSLKATISRGLSDWVNTLSATRKDSLGGLRNETKGYIEKIRYLQEKSLP